MPKQLTTVKVSREFILEYDPEDPNFQDSLLSFRQSIKDGATVPDMLRYVAKEVERLGHETFLEGVGKLDYPNRNEPVNPLTESGIKLLNPRSGLETEIIRTVPLIKQGQ